MSNIINLGAVTAYGIALKHGFIGTEEEWLESLKPDVRQEMGDSEDAVMSQKIVTEIINSLLERISALEPLAEVQGETLFTNKTTLRNGRVENEILYVFGG